ncbi:MAG: MBL fold metallo-hydrolase [Lachnospiraceae bacterium]|nr:MBL fold metallo-hydrolase [Lachnospiraceae bacterium]
MYRDSGRKWYKKGKALLEDIQSTDLPGEQVAVWYIGQCGFVLKSKSTIIYIDPVLNDICDERGNTVRLYEAPYKPGNVTANYVFCTHGHIDHMAVETIKGISSNNPQVKIIVPGACKDILVAEEIAHEKIIEAAEEKEINLSGIQMIPFSTAHPVHSVGEEGKDKNLAYYIVCGQVSFLHMGDTYLTDHLVDRLKSCTDPDVLMVPINGTDFYLERQDIIGNMTAREAAKLSKELGADLTIPMHFDMVEGNTVNPLHFVEELWQVDSAMKFSIPALGERILIMNKAGRTKK